MLEVVVDTLRPLVDEVVVAVPVDFIDEITAQLQDRAAVIMGGRSRHESIGRLLAASAGEVVLIHDGARPFASPQLCSAVLAAATQHGAAGAFLDPTVPVGRLEHDVVASCQPRQEARLCQTPQAYRRDILHTAYHKSAGLEFPSTVQLVIAGGYTLHSISGEPENIKITTSLDWLIAERVLAPLMGLDA